MRDERPEFSSNPTDAILLPLPHRHPYSALEFLRMILGAWLDAEVGPYVDRHLESHRKHSPPGQRKHYHALQDGELLEYFLSRCLEALQRHRKHKLNSRRLSAAATQLMNSHRIHALSARFAADGNVLAAILASWTPHICSFLGAGSVGIVDESMFAHWGKNADDKHFLQQIPGKPHDFGMVAYVYAQRGQHTDLPLALALMVNHINATVTPTDAAIALFCAVKEVDGGDFAERQLVADSLWSAQSVLNKFDLHHIKYCVSLKSDSKVIPAPLYDVSSADLPKNKGRTYTNGTLVLEVVNTGKQTVRLLTNMCLEGDGSKSDRRTIGAYATAVHLFDKETPVELVRMFGLDAEWAKSPSEVIIHKHLGWDVLRPVDQQGSNAPLTFAAVKDMKVSQLRRIRQLKLPTARSSVGTKEDILHELFPEEQRKADAEQAEAQKRGHKRRARERLRELSLIRERVRNFIQITFQIGTYLHWSRCAGPILVTHLFGTSTIHTTMPSIA